MKISEKAIKELIKLRSEKIKDPTKTLKIVTFPLWQGEGDFGIVIQERFDSDIIIKNNILFILYPLSLRESFLQCLHSWVNRLSLIHI